MDIITQYLIDRYGNDVFYKPEDLKKSIIATLDYFTK